MQHHMQNHKHLLYNMTNRDMIHVSCSTSDTNKFPVIKNTICGLQEIYCILAIMNTYINIQKPQT